MVLSDSTSDSVLTRAVNACMRLGTDTHAQAAAYLAQDESKPSLSRIEAMGVLENWIDPPSRDRIVGMWRPVEGKTNRTEEPLNKALRGQLDKLLECDHEIRIRAARLAGKLKMAEATGKLNELLWDEGGSGKERAGALLALAEIQPDGFDQTLEQALECPEERIRAAARIVMTDNQHEAALPELKKALTDGSQLEKQSAIFTLSKVGNDTADKILLSAMRALVAGKIYPAVRLDIREAAHKREQANPLIQEQLGKYLAQWDADDLLAPIETPWKVATLSVASCSSGNVFPSNAFDVMSLMAMVAKSVRTFQTSRRR